MPNKEPTHAYTVDLQRKLDRNVAGSDAHPVRRLEKAFTIPANFRLVRNHGSGVPSREQRKLMAAVERPAPKFNAMMLLDHTEPRYGPDDIVKGLFSGNAGAEQSWSKFLAKTFASSPNELVMRKAIYEKMQEEKLDPALRKALFQRSMSFYRDIRKSMIQVLSADELKKADARGGTYHRRVRTSGGKYRYFYDEEKYKQSKHAQESGPDAQKAYISKTLSGMVEKAGDSGCDITSFKSLAKKYGAKAVSDALKQGCTEGGMMFKKGKFYAKGGKK